LRELLTELRLFDDSVEVSHIFCLCRCEAVTNYRRENVYLHHVGVRADRDDGGLEISDEPQQSFCFRFLLEVRDEESRWIIFESGDFILRGLPRGPAVTALVQSGSENLRLVDLCSHDAFECLFQDRGAWIDEECWVHSLHLVYDIGVQGAEKCWERQFPESDPICLDDESFRPDPDNQFGGLVDYSGGCVRIAYRLMEDGFISAEYTFIPNALESGA
jgi:hypothetical protein